MLNDFWDELIVFLFGILLVEDAMLLVMEPDTQEAILDRKAGFAVQAMLQFSAVAAEG